MGEGKEGDGVGVPAWHSKRAEVAHCFYCDKPGYPWFLCDCESSVKIREGKLQKPRVRRLRNGGTVVEHDASLLSKVLAHGRFSRFIPGLGGRNVTGGVTGNAEETPVTYPERPMTGAERVAAYRKRVKERGE